MRRNTNRGRETGLREKTEQIYFRVRLKRAVLKIEAVIDQTMIWRLIGEFFIKVEEGDKSLTMSQG